MLNGRTLQDCNGKGAGSPRGRKVVKKNQSEEEYD
jgi:hypothetical protein